MKHVYPSVNNIKQAWFSGVTSFFLYINLTIYVAGKDTVVDNVVPFKW